MNEDHYKRLTAMLLDTLNAQQEQIKSMLTEIKRLSPEAPAAVEALEKTEA